MAAFHLFQVLFGWRFLLPLTLYSCLLFFIGHLSKLLCLRCFTGENSPTSHADMVLSPSCSTFFTDTPSFPPPLSTARLSAAFLLLPASVSSSCLLCRRCKLYSLNKEKIVAQQSSHHFLILFVCAYSSPFQGIASDFKGPSLTLLDLVLVRGFLLHFLSQILPS